MKTQYVALLRGINVGGTRIIKNTDLQKCFEEMGFEHVEIFLQSGNVVFTSAESQSKLKTSIEKGLQNRFNYPAKVIVKDIPSIRRIVEKYPFDRSKTEVQHYVVFLSEDVGAEMIRSVNLDRDVEDLAAGDHVIYWTVIKGMTLKSVIGKLLSKAKYKELNTVRNINTLEKVVR